MCDSIRLNHFFERISQITHFKIRSSWFVWFNHRFVSWLKKSKCLTRTPTPTGTNEDGSARCVQTSVGIRSGSDASKPSGDDRAQGHAGLRAIKDKVPKNRSWELAWGFEGEQVPVRGGLGKDYSGKRRWIGMGCCEYLSGTLRRTIGKYERCDRNGWRVVTGHVRSLKRTRSEFERTLHL